MKHHATPLGAERLPSSCENPFMARSRRGLGPLEWTALALSIGWIIALVVVAPSLCGGQ